MKDDLDKFFVEQRKRIQRFGQRGGKTAQREGELANIPEAVDLRVMAVEMRGNCSHASGRRKPSADDQAAIMERGRIFPGKRRQVLWSNLERKAGRMEKWKGKGRE